MSESPTPQQALLLWCLLGRGGTAPQGTLVPEVRKADREALIAFGYLEVGTPARPLRLTVTDKGWNWARTHMDAALPPAFQVLQDWLGRIGADLAATGRHLADLVGPVFDAPPPATAPARAAKSPEDPKASKPRKTAAPKKPPRPEKSPSPKKPPSPKKLPGPKQLRARIEAAYLALTGGERARPVRLTALRAELGDLDRATLDSGLAAILSGDRTARLSQFSDPRSLDAAERAAAFSPAGEPFHILWIQS